MRPFLSKNTNDAPVAPVAVVGGLETDRFHLEDGKQLKSDKKEKKSISRRTWEEKFALLRLYKKVHGNVNPPPTYVTPCGVKLGGWVATQRKEYAKYQAGFFSMIVNDRRIARLERAGFEWQPTTKHRLASVWLNRAFGQFATNTFVHSAPFTVGLTSDAPAVANFG